MFDEEHLDDHHYCRQEIQELRARITQLEKQLSDEQQLRVDAQLLGDKLQAEVKLLREFVKAKDEYIACYKLGKRPTERLFKELDRLAAALQD